MLDPDEILAVTENLQQSSKLTSGPAARRVSETLCVEIEKLLVLLELEVKQSQMPAT
jgi:hypothetical protein